MSGNYLLDAYFVNSLSLYNDTDSDTYGNPDAATGTCLEIISGYVNNNLDCNDTLAKIYPGATELRNYLEDDCYGLADDNLTYLHTYQDADDNNFRYQFIDSLSCELPTGYVSDSTDCDDTNSDIYPGAIEILNGLDDDCDQIADEGLSINELQVEQISLYPNPAFNTIQIISNFSEVGIFTVYTHQQVKR
ncbi:MAG: putative metal-binding motif-containing protein [Bacteroidetes bacterium]|nr:putative metal-binding motif-containing protein [Bacteroidota bacterium]